MKLSKKATITLISALALVSVSAIGFSRWIVGVQQKDTTKKITAEVDDTKNDSLVLTASIASSSNLILAEKEIYTRQPGLDIIGASSSKGDMEVSSNALSFTFESMQIIVGANQTNPTGVNLSFDEKAHSFITVDATADKLGIVASNDLRSGSSWTYIGFEDVTIPFSDFEKDDETSVEGSYTVYNLKSDKSTYSFLWGSFFGNTTITSDSNISPVNYYNNLLKVANDEPDTGYKLKEGVTALDLVNTANNAGTELNDMATTFASKTLTIKVTLNEASEG